MPEEPKITLDEVRTLLKFDIHGGLVFIKDSAGSVFFAYNGGVNDSGEGLNIRFFGRVVDNNNVPISDVPEGFNA